jgi:murein DD-endopeptidase MepM/ murein hydrolase activator NlpD
LKKKFNKKNILKFIDKIVEHNYFKLTSISIITSFVLFNSISYLSNSLLEQPKPKPKSTSQIKINIGNFKEKLNQIEDQVLRHKVKPQETLSEILFKLGANEYDVNNILFATKKIFDPRDIFQGQKLTIKYKTIIGHKNNDSSQGLVRKSIISKISLSPNPELNMIVSRVKDGSYKSKKSKKKLIKHVVRYSGKINNSLFADGVEAGVSPKIMIEIINLYSFDVDFQRDLRKGDHFEVVFEDFYDTNGDKIKNGNILFSALKLKNHKKPLEAYLFNNGRITEYFDKKGRSVRKSLLRTPINGARISSRFGYRKHPVLGYRKKHKGLDFAARRGTPILSAGKGVIDYIGRRGGYGNYVRIKHNSNYSTAYAHASRFARRLRKGSRVKQGQVIAYVGTTGRSTGPHLHYEVLKNGIQVNPSRIKTTSGIKLVGSKLRKFKAARDAIEELRQGAPNQNKS